jgi:hypothetical protein
MSPKQVWSQCLAVWELSCFLSATLHGEALYRLGVQGVEVFILLDAFFSAKCGSSVSAKFLIYGVHTVCFCTLVPIWITQKRPFKRSCGLKKTLMIPMNIKKMVGETFLLHQFVLLVNHKRK